MQPAPVTRRFHHGAEIREHTFAHATRTLARSVLNAARMSKHPIKKLALRSEILRSLTPDELIAVAGGADDEPLPPRNPGQAFTQPWSGKPDGCMPKSVLRPCEPFRSGIRPCIDNE